MSREADLKALKAWVKWTMVNGRPTDTDSLYQFATFIGDPHEEGRLNIINIDNPEVMKRVDMINGPNGHTLLKMWIAQDGKQEILSQETTDKDVDPQ